jgi:hypothetical protein
MPLRMFSRTTKLKTRSEYTLASEEIVQYLLCAHRPQILSVTCDNASANDAMIDHLAKVLPAFPGAANRTRCFTHILNLVAKCIMKQFDSPKPRKGAKPDRDVASESDDEEFKDLAAALDELEDELEDEDEIEVGHEKIDDEIEETMLDGRKGMTAEEIRALERSVKPVRLVLTKVCRLSKVCWHVRLTRCSFGRLLTPLKTPLRLFCPSGSAFSTVWPSRARREVRRDSPVA